MSDKTWCPACGVVLNPDDHPAPSEREQKAWEWCVKNITRTDTSVEHRLYAHLSFMVADAFLAERERQRQKGESK